MQREMIKYKPKIKKSKFTDHDKARIRHKIKFHYNRIFKIQKVRDMI